MLLRYTRYTWHSWVLGAQTWPALSHFVAFQFWDEIPAELNNQPQAAPCYAQLLPGTFPVSRDFQSAAAP